MWDSVPWLVGGGAEHSPEVARLLAYAATSGAEGIVSPGDLKVQALTVPGSQVRVMPGACLVRSRAAAASQETYVGRNVGQDTVAISATGSGSGRSDLIVARVEDPFVAGEPWSEPSDPKVGPYIFTRVIPGVAAGTTELPAGMTGIPLARIDLPANTATITNEMITDLRQMALPRQSRSLDIAHHGGPRVPTPSTPGKWTIPMPTFRVPEWATYVHVVTTIASVEAPPQLIDMSMSSQIGPVVGVSSVVDLDNAGLAGVAHTRETVILSAQGDISSAAGTSVSMSLNVSPMRGELGWIPGSHIVQDVTFYEQRV